jgi:NDP-sugar pyrophosphorylase family protein
VVDNVSMQVMILAAGRSTRLGSLGTTLPKPLIPICGYPAIRYAIELCRRAELWDIVINLHHFGDKISQFLGDGSQFGVRLRYSWEEELLGTGGGLRKARALFSPGPVLVINGKVAVDVDLRQVVAAHEHAPPGTLATMVVREDSNPGLWAPLGVDGTSAVLSIRGKLAERTSLGPLQPRMFTGIHVLQPGLLDELPDGVSDIIGDAYIPALLGGRRIHSLTISGYFAEHSTPQRYLEGNMALLTNPGLLPQAPGDLVGVDLRAQVDPSAIIVQPVRIAAGAIVEAKAIVGPSVVVGEGAKVACDAEVSGSVIWGGATAHGKITGSVVMPNGILFAETTPTPVSA